MSKLIQKTEKKVKRAEKNHRPRGSKFCCWKIVWFSHGPKFLWRSELVMGDYVNFDVEYGLSLFHLCFFLAIPFGGTSPHSSGLFFLGVQLKKHVCRKNISELKKTSSPPSFIFIPLPSPPPPQKKFQVHQRQRSRTIQERNLHKRPGLWRPHFPHQLGIRGGLPFNGRAFE